MMSLKDNELGTVAKDDGVEASCKRVQMEVC